MELCKNGCGDVWNSPELLEVIDLLLGKNTAQEITSNTSIEDITLHATIERRVKQKLAAKKGNNHDKR